MGRHRACRKATTHVPFAQRCSCKNPYKSIMESSYRENGGAIRKQFPMINGVLPVHGGHYSVLPLVRASVKFAVHLPHRDALGVQLVDDHFLVSEALCVIRVRYMAKEGRARTNESQLFVASWCFFLEFGAYVHQREAVRIFPRERLPPSRPSMQDNPPYGLEPFRKNNSPTRG